MTLQVEKFPQNPFLFLSFFFSLEFFLIFPFLSLSFVVFFFFFLSLLSFFLAFCLFSYFFHFSFFYCISIFISLSILLSFTHFHKHNISVYVQKSTLLKILTPSYLYIHIFCLATNLRLNTIDGISRIIFFSFSIVNSYSRLFNCSS